MLVTGGWPNTYTTVSQYNEAGWVRDLPQLQQGRRHHGCSSYNNAEGTKVGIDINYYRTIIIFQTYLVAGGLGRDGRLLSTELLVENFLVWVKTGELPFRWGVTGLRGASIDNRVLITGN